MQKITMTLFFIPKGIKIKKAGKDKTAPSKHVVGHPSTHNFYDQFLIDNYKHTASNPAEQKITLKLTGHAAVSERSV